MSELIINKNELKELDSILERDIILETTNIEVEPTKDKAKVKFSTLVITTIVTILISSACWFTFTNYIMHNEYNNKIEEQKTTILELENKLKDKDKIITENNKKIDEYNKTLKTLQENIEKLEKKVNNL